MLCLDSVSELLIGLLEMLFCGRSGLGACHLSHLAIDLNTSLVLDLYVDWIDLGASLGADLGRLVVSSVHGVVHDSTLVNSLPRVHEGVLLAGCLPNWAVSFVSLGVVSHISVELLAIWLRHDAASNYSESTRILALSIALEVG